jgi:O-antigen ligase
LDAQDVRDAVGFDVQTAHNSFLEVYFSAGIIVFMLLLAVIFVGFYTGFEGQKEMGTNNTFVLMLVYIFTHSLFESSLFSSYLWFGLFVASFGLRASRRFRRAGAGS